MIACVRYAPKKPNEGRGAEEKKCNKCGDLKKESEFSPKAWRTPAQRVCKGCATKPAEEKQCNKCGDMQGKAAFSDKAWRTQGNAYARRASETPEAYGNAAIAKS